MLKDVKHHKDGSTEVTIRRLTRRIRALDGSFRTMVSLDGETWRWDEKEQELARSLQAAQNLQGARWAKQKKKEFDAKLNPGITTDSWMNAVPKHGSPILGKAKGKAQKFRRNLRRKKEKLPVIAKPVHHHSCRDHGKQFSCSCDKPYLSQKCGGKMCLHKTLMEALWEKSKELGKSQAQERGRKTTDGPVRQRTDHGR